MSARLITNEADLRRPCEPCRTVAEGLRIGRELLDFCKRYNREQVRYSAAGLAAIQLGILKRVCMVLTNPKVPLVLVNPRIVNASQTRIPWTETCISLPRQKTNTYRHNWVVVEADNLAQPYQSGRDIVLCSAMSRQFQKMFLEAVCLQHEIGHVESKLMTDFQEDKDFWTGCNLSVPVVYWEKGFRL